MTDLNTRNHLASQNEPWLDEWLNGDATVVHFLRLKKDEKKNARHKKARRKRKPRDTGSKTRVTSA